MRQHTIYLHLACLTPILKIYKQNSKFVIQNNDNQKNDRENSNNNRNERSQENKLCKISIMRLFCLNPRIKMQPISVELQAHAVLFC